MTDRHDGLDRDALARLRFAIIGPLLAAPPPQGELQAALRELSRRTWQDPRTGAPIRFGASTIERWLYAARRAHADPVAALRDRPRPAIGHARLLSAAVLQAIDAQYRAHPSWSVLLHYDNLCAALGAQALPSYATVRRYFKAHGLDKQPRRRRLPPGTAVDHHTAREVRSFEVDHVNALWHLDLHHGSRQVLTAQGAWMKPLALCILDDRSRLVCHLQWYTSETTRDLVHGFCQALSRRALPRALQNDN